MRTLSIISKLGKVVSRIDYPWAHLVQDSCGLPFEFTLQYYLSIMDSEWGIPCISSLQSSHPQVFTYYMTNSVYLFSPVVSSPSVYLLYD